MSSIMYYFPEGLRSRMFPRRSVYNIFTISVVGLLPCVGDSVCVERRSTPPAMGYAFSERGFFESVSVYLRCFVLASFLGYEDTLGS